MTLHTSSKIYDFIRKTIEAEGIAPSVREIADSCYLSKTTVIYHLILLESRGRITRIPGKARGIQLPRTNDI